jgi:hypothetical protein
MKHDGLGFPGDYILNKIGCLKLQLLIQYVYNPYNTKKEFRAVGLTVVEK